MASKNHKLFYGSSYDRGLDIVLQLWPKIIEKFPDATLDVCYGWDLFDKGYANNPERMAWKNKIDEKMKQKGITHHGRVGKRELEKIRSKCGIWVYPTYFQEINCITALESQRDGLVPVTMDDFALSETVHSGFKIKGDIYDYEARKEWLSSLFKLMGNQKLLKDESIKGKIAMVNYSWDKVAEDWLNEIKA